MREEQRRHDERLREEQKRHDERLREEQKAADERLREEQRMNGKPVLGYTLGAPQLSLDHYVSDISVPGGRQTSLAFFNPSESESQIELTTAVDDAVVQPFELFVPPGGRVVVNYEGEQRIPKDKRVGATARVLNGVPVTSQLVITADESVGIWGGSFLMPSSFSARHWVVATGGIAEPSENWIYVANTSAAEANVQFTLTGDGNSSTQPAVKIPAGGRYGFHVNELSPNGAAGVVVNSDVAVVVSREVGVTPGPSLTAAPGVALRN